MADFLYPTNDFDRRNRLLAEVASFWNNVFGQREFVRDILFAKGQLEQQTVQQLTELFDSVSRFKLPPFHLERWYLITLLESDLNQGKAAQLLYDGEVDYDPTGPFKYGVPRQLNQFTWDAPAELVDTGVLVNRIHDASLTMTRGVDFLLEDGSLFFRENPFDNPLVPVRDIVVGQEVVDRQIGLWVFQAKFDWDYIFEQFGYVIQLSLESGDEYKGMINAVFDALVEGTTQRSVENAFEAMTGSTLVQNPTETVKAIVDEPGRQLVITDQVVYEYSDLVSVIVSVGDKVIEGQALVDTLQFFEFNRGQCPTQEQCQAVALGRGFLGRGFFGDLVFENKSTPLVVETDDEGYTKVSWEIGGFPTDVVKFFDDLHANGLAAGQTLANLLDTRTNKVGEPQASNLPTTINPFEFLCQNVLRNHAYLAKIRTAGFGPGAVGMNAGKILRKVHPPQTALIIAAELAHTDDPIIMEDPGTETAPGYEETVSTYTGMVQAETISPDTAMDECVRVKLISGRCT